MGLALCHFFPRDLLLRLAVLFILIAFILQAAAIGRHNSKTASGFITIKGEGKPNILAYVAAHPAVYDAALSVKLCNPSSAVLTYQCAQFAEAFHIVNGLCLGSFITAFIAFVVVGFVVARVSKGSISMLRRILISTCLPFSLQCAAVGVFFARVVPHAKRVVASSLPPDTKLAFHRRYAPDLMITATALLGAAFVIAAIRLIVNWCAMRRLKSAKVTKEKDVQLMMRLHLVNDDWVRQKQILSSHAKSVQVEMQIKEEAGSVEDSDDAETDDDGNQHRDGEHSKHRHGGRHGDHSDTPFTFKMQGSYVMDSEVSHGEAHTQPRGGAFSDPEYGAHGGTGGTGHDDRSSHEPAEL